MAISYSLNPDKQTIWVSAGTSHLCHHRKWTALFNHLVGGDQQARRHSEAKCLGGLKIDDEAEPRRLFER